MLTSSSPSNQYLRPDYLTPLPTTLDAKNSPLALLAQTCSAIGADTPNPKLLANIEKSTKSLKTIETREKSSPVSSQSSSLSSNSMEQQQPKSCFKPYESLARERNNSIGDDQGTIRIKTPKNFQNSHTVPITNGNRCDSNQSATSQRDSPTVVRKTPSLSQENNTSPNRASSKESGNGSLNATQESLSSRLSADIQKECFSQLTAKTSSGLSSTTASSYFTGYPPGIPYPVDLMTASALMSPHHHQMLKAAALSPYLNYARMKGNDPTSLIPSVCRDPYCTGCPISSHVMSKATGQPCPAGCSQCEHSSSKSYQQHNSVAAAAYAHAQLAALAAASQLPYVCSWIAGDTAYCGKRFATSDELFQHLRTHTASMPESMLNAAVAGIPPTHSIFQRTYPTPPLSPLSTARYHPYGKPTMLPPTFAPSSLTGLPIPPHPSLAQYFAPYSIYGPRLGTSPSMHP